MPYSRRQLEALELTPRYVGRPARTPALDAQATAPTAADTAHPPAPAALAQAAHMSAPQPALPSSRPQAPALAQPINTNMPRAKPPPPAATAEQSARQHAIMQLDWAGLAAAAGTCDACGLCKQRQQAVLGVGHPQAPWLFVGEGPGADEDERGEPFVGAAGKLLDGVLAATGLARGREVYIANVVKCRPPSNRTPTPEEATACAPFLDRQVALIQPKLIVALGKTAAVRMTGQDAAMGSLRGKVWDYQSIPVVVTYHPAYLLRNLPEKAKAWEDMLFAKAVMAERGA